MKTYDVTALGELLIDFTENGISGQGNPVLEANPGGAPCNVLSMLSKLGHKGAFIGKIGDDMFGNQLTYAIKEVGIDTTGLKRDSQVHTTLAFVHTFPDGDREFSFYRNPGADMMLTEDEINTTFISQAKIFHFGTLSMTQDSVRAATKKAVKAAKESGVLISFDPNLREPLWSSLELAKEQMNYGFSQCDILKISDNEIQFVTGKEDYDEGIRCLQEKYQIPLILLTMGKEGSRAGFSVKTIETTGAGDTFTGSVLNYLLEHDFNNLTEKQLEELLKLANAAAAIVTTRKGVIRAIPKKSEIEELIQRNML